MLEKLKQLIRNPFAHVASIPVAPLAAPVQIQRDPPFSHKHSFSCVCDSCTITTAELTEKRLATIRK